MKITRTVIGDEDIVLGENIAEIIIEMGETKFFLRSRIRDNKGYLTIINTNYLDEPVRRFYLEPLSNGVCIQQYVWTDEENLDD